MIYNWEIILSKNAEKSLLKIEPSYKDKIKSAILELSINPLFGDVKKLKGEYNGFYRKRVGVYRIIYEINKNKIIITIVDILIRGNSYK